MIFLAFFARFVYFVVYSGTVALFIPGFSDENLFLKPLKMREFTGIVFVVKAFMSL